MEIDSQTEYRGLLTRRYGESIAKGFATLVINGDHGSSSMARNEKAYSEFGNQSNPNDNITRKFRYERGNGFESQLQVRDDGTNSYLEVLHEGDIRNSENGEWLILVSGLTTGKIMGATPFNDTGVDNFLFCNGVENFSRWSGAMCVIDGDVAAGASTITVKKISGDPKTNPTDGFPSSGTIIYRDTAGVYKSLAYSSKTATEFTMTTPGNTTAVGDNAGIMHAADTSTYSGLPKNNILITHEGRVKGTGNPAQPTVVDGSEVSDFTDFTPAVNPDDPFSRDFPEDGENTALMAIDQWLLVGKKKGVWAHQIVYQSATTRSEVVKRIGGIGVSNQKAVALAGNEWWGVSSRGRIFRILRADAEGVFNQEDLSSAIRPTIEDYVWDDAAMEYFEKRNMLLVSAKADSNSSANDRVVVAQISNTEDGELTVNFGILDWFISDMCVYNDDLYHGSGAESRNFKSFDSYAKNGAAYRWVRRDKIMNMGSPFETKTVRYFGVAGLIGPGTTLNFEFFYGENGSLGSITKSLSYSDGAPFVVQSALNMLGSFENGINPLGGFAKDDVEDLSPFLCFFELPVEYATYTWQREVYTDGVGQKAVILKEATIYDDAEEDIRSDLII